jgi:hypothetical protein
MTEYYYLPELFNIIKEYLINDYYALLNYAKEIKKTIFDKYYYDQNDKKTNKLNDEYINLTSKSIFLETIEKTENSQTNIVSINFPTDTIYPRKYIYKNLRFGDDVKSDIESDIEKDIEKIEFVIGSKVINVVPLKFYKTLQKFYEMDGIPLNIFKYGHISNLFHSAHVNIILKNTRKITLLADKYLNPDHNIVNPNTGILSTYKPLKCHVYQASHIYHHEFNVKPIDNEIELFVYMPTYMLLCSHKLTKIKLILNDKKEFKLNQYGKIIRLTPKIDSDNISNYAINFSRISSVKLKFDSPYSNKIYITNLRANILMIQSGLSGLKFYR